MKRLTSLWRELALESASWCGTSANRDIKTVTARVEAEGESFLTISLPRYAKAFERALETGTLDSSSFSGFHCRRGLPEFLRGFLSQIFDPSGTLLDEPSIDCISSVRMLTMCFGKIQRLCSDARVADAMQQFVQIEQELAEFDTSNLEREIFPLFRQASTLLWADVFSYVENSVLDRHQLAHAWLSSEEDYQRKLRVEHAGRSGPDPLDLIIGIGQEKPIKVGVRNGSIRMKASEEVHVFDGETVGHKGFFPFVPRHGPGATADGLRGNAKFSIKQWPRRLESVFPYGDYALPQLALEDELDRVEFLEPGAELPVKVTPVPKTDKTPRIIAVEPTAMQYTQQALCHQVVYRLEHGREFPPPWGGKEFDLGRFFVGFADQEPNRFLAKKGSLDGSLATLDLSEASDRVLNSHVKLLFERFPRLSEGIQATRSTHADVQGHGVIPLTKFASMGSALCFPVEAMVFTTIVFAAIAYECGVPVNRKLIMSMRGKVRVYGDDIIVPVEFVQRVIQFLELFGLKVNKDKSFWNGKFRESCGGDFYDGEWVTPVRLRRPLPRSLADTSDVVALIAFRNLLYWEGYWQTVSKLDDRISALLKGRWKIIEHTAAGLGRESVCFAYKADRTDPNLFTPIVDGAIVKHTIPKSKASGSGALLKFLLKRSLIPSQDGEHLNRQGRPVASRIVLRGIRPY